MHRAGLQLLHGEKDGQRGKKAKKEKEKKNLEFCELGLLPPLIFALLISEMSAVSYRWPRGTDETTSDHSSLLCFPCNFLPRTADGTANEQKRLGRGTDTAAAAAFGDLDGVAAKPNVQAEEEQEGEGVKKGGNMAGEEEQVGGSAEEQADNQFERERGSVLAE